MSALYACLKCKSRKGACDKTLPSCTFCTLRSFVCVYPTPVSSDQATPPQPVDVSVRHGQRVSVDAASLTSGVKSDLLLLHSVCDSASLIAHDELPRQNEMSSDAIWHKRVTRLIQTTGLSIATIYSHYIEGIYRCIPVISPQQFDDYQKIVTSGQAPSARFSMLMLCATLVVLDTRHVSPPTQLVDRTSLYFTVKSLIARLMVLPSPSTPVALIQAGILVSLFEFHAGWYVPATSTISSTHLLMETMVDTFDNSSVAAPRPWENEALLENTGWCIVVAERQILCALGWEASVPLSQFPSTEIRLLDDRSSFTHTDSVRKSFPVQLLVKDNSDSVQGFARISQAAGYLDRVLHLTRRSPTDPALWEEAASLDQDLQQYLKSSLVLAEQKQTCCSTVATLVAAMFLLHNYLIAKPQKVEPRGAWLMRSHAALETAAKVMADVAKAYLDGAFDCSTDGIPICCAYCMRSALNHMKASSENEKGVEQQIDYKDIRALEILLSMLESRWQS